MDKFTNYKLKITDKNKELVKAYLQKMKKFVEKYNIEKDLYNDIEDMVFEKLSNQKKLDQLSITKILKEVGEPEVIFADYVENQNTPILNSFPLDKGKDEAPNSPHSALPKRKRSEDKGNGNDNSPFYEKLIKAGWIRDNENAIIYGISGMLSEKSKIPTWVINILFIAFNFIGGVGSSVYFILGLILPIKGIDYKGKTFGEYFKIQLYHCIVDFFQNVWNSLKRLVKWLTNKEPTEGPKKDDKISSNLKENVSEKITKDEIVKEEIKTQEKPKTKKSFFKIILPPFIYIFNILIFILKTIMKYIGPILRFIVFTIISITLFGIFISFLALFSVSFVENTSYIDFTNILPTYTKWGFLAGIISIGIFLVASVIYAFNGKGINKYTLISGFVAFVIMIFLLLNTTFSLLSVYGQINNYKQELQVELDNNKDITLDLSQFVGIESSFYSTFINSTIGQLNYVKLVNSTGSILKLDVEYVFLGNNEIKDIFKNKIVEPIIVKKDSVLELTREKIFSEKVPLFYVENYITIHLPEGYTINFGNNYYPLLINAYTTFEKTKYKDSYSPHYFGSCSGKKVWYSTDEEMFICDPDESELNEVRKKYLEQYIVKNFDEISQITHKNEYKKEYRNSNTYWNNNEGIKSDWDFHNFYWENEDTVKVGFRDNSLDIEIKLDIEETETGAIFLNLEINYLDVNYSNFDSEHYENIDIDVIKHWLPESLVTNGAIGNTDNEQKFFYEGGEPVKEWELPKEPIIKENQTDTPTEVYDEFRE